MNNHGPAIPHIQPAVPHYSGRRHHDMPYTQTHAQPAYPHHYQGYHHAMPQQYHQQPPPQWYQYQNMQAPIPRPYQQYYPMVNSPYSMPHNSTTVPNRPTSLQHTPSSSSIRLQQSLLSPSPANRSPHVLPPTPASIPTPELAPPPPRPASAHRLPFYPPLPWYSVSEGDFPRKPSRRRRRRPLPQSSNIPVEFPARVELSEVPEVAEVPFIPESTKPTESQDHSDGPVASISATPTTSQAPSEADSTQPTTPSSAVAQQSLPRTLPSSGSKSGGRQLGKIIPVVPVVPYISGLSRSSKRQSISIASENTKVAEVNSALRTSLAIAADISEEVVDTESVKSDQTSKAASPEIKAGPKSWADLVRTKNSPSALNGTAHGSPISQHIFSSSKSSNISDVLTSFNVANSDIDSKIAFLEPRGLVNTGNMCYMNAILQVLLFCVPFYKFFNQVGKQATHSFKSDTPLIDAMIMFMHEFPVIDSVASIEQLRLRLKPNELEQYGEAFTPEFVYEVIRRLPRFSSMRRGHQQDAEEFLGFLLEELHDECVRAMKVPVSKSPNSAAGTGETSLSPISENGKQEENGWLEVGPKQKAAITRSSGTIAVESPITKIFGGKLRSELRIPGAKISVTLEPYQPLQLDIGSPQVNNIIDALKGLTRSETLHGDFNSPRGPGNAATKQVFIETLPPVLLLHLKRFQYDNTGGTQKIWKKIGYPLDLELPKEVFPQHKRGTYAAHGGLPKYRLIGVVYHHGKNASGGHYTVDVRRQDGHEWIRLDDTVIRRVKSEDVAEGGSEEDPKDLAAALEQHRNVQAYNGNIFNSFQDEGAESTPPDSGWSQVNGTANGSGTATKKWSGVVNGVTTPTNSSGKRTPVGRFSVRDNKVAYILMYQRI